MFIRVSKMSTFTYSLTSTVVIKNAVILNFIHSIPNVFYSSLFTFVNENHLNSTPTFQKFIALLDNYNKNIGQTEELTPAELDEIENFLTTIIPIQVMQLAYGYLFDKGK